MEAAAFLGLGTIFLMIFVTLHFEISRKSSFQEKAFVTILCTSLLFVVLAVITYTFVNVEYKWTETTHGGYAYYRFNDIADKFVDARSMAPPTGVTPKSDIHYKLDLIVTRVYGDYAVLFCEVGIVLFFLFVYIKQRFL
ncbi:MAG: hypothetical protein QHH18_02775 [Candidatus Bathyarchaeota archaeon]|nr:hypothetical protein [Candidatus Bathyarchaeota archaeon A05DMB-5]MDH7557518.1 hypothetical protein [Candidatus Bathyarchaeota archaeon]